MQRKVPVTFAPSGPTVWVESGTMLAEAARSAGVLLATPCAGRGVCAGCGVRVLSGSLDPADEVELGSLKRAPEGVRLACRARVNGPVEVRPLFATPAAVVTAVPRAAVVESSDEAGIEAECQPTRLVAGVDLGTTSVAALLVDLMSGREVARASVPNRQQSLGADVLSRLSAAQAGHGGELQRLVAVSVREALDLAAREGDVSECALERVVLAGNSAMAALFEGADVTSLTAHPFEPPARGGELGRHARELIGLDADTSAVLVAPIAAFVGGDALAATVAAGLVDVDSPTLLVDIGTNAELVLARPEGLLVTSAAAGPAFEGVGIASGGPAIAGAVERVRIDGGDIVLDTIGGVSARWLSGAGLVSAVAALVAAGHVGPDGLMRAEGSLASRFACNDDGVLGVDLAPIGSEPLVLSQLDVRALQLAKAAVRVGIETLLQRAGLAAAELTEVLVAGAFGAALAPADLIALGVLPAAATLRTRRIGNAALEGAAALALDPGLAALAERTAIQAEHVDLAAEAAFGAAFVRATEFGRYQG